MAERIKIAFASGSEDLIPTLLEKMASVFPEVPLYVVSEFAPPVAVAGWVRWRPSKGVADNRARLEAFVAGREVLLVGIILQPNMPYWDMRWTAARRWPWRLMVFNENLDHFMLRPRSVPAMAGHLFWRLKNLVRWELRPGGGTYTLLWRLAHPWAFRRPLVYRLALLSGRLALRLRRPGALVPVVEPSGERVSVVVPSRNGRELLERLLGSLEGQWPFEVIVVDNGSTDGTAEWLGACYAAVVVEVSAAPLSFAAAVNRGIARARGERICLLNNDMVLEAGFCGALTGAFARNPGLFAATAQIFFPAGVRREETGKAMFRPGGEAFPVRCELPLEGEDGTWVLYGSGGCTLYDAAKLRALGGFGEQFQPAYVEDLDLGWRAWRRGWPTVFVAGARVEHRHRSTTSKYYSEAELELVLERNYVRFAAGAGSWRLWRQAVDRLNELAARLTPVRSAERALLGAWREPWRQPMAAAGTDDALALCGGAVAVFPGRARSIERPCVLVAAPYLPYPLAHGGAVRMFNLMREASGEFDQVLLVFADSLQTPAAELLQLCVEIVLVRRAGTHLLPRSDRPDVVEEHDQPEFRAALAAVRRKWSPALVQLEFTQMGLYAAACRPAPVLLVEHDITFDLYGQLLAGGADYDTREQYGKWMRFEQAAWAQVDAVVVMSEKDRRTVGLPQARAVLNGVDLARFQPILDEPEARRLLFIGSFAHLPNLLALSFFLDEAWPLLAGRGVTLHVIAGQRHEYFLDHYADRVSLELAQPGIVLEGFVNDVRAAYGKATVVIAPLRASAGTNIKIMEAMAMRKAIVSTPGGVNGLDLEDGVGVRVVSTGEEMAAVILDLLDRPEERRRLETEARRLAEERYGWERIGRVQAALYRELLGGAG